MKEDFSVTTLRKGKFGFVLCFYPIAAFAAVILNSPLICTAIAAAAVFLERDEWTGRQTLQAWMASILVYFFDNVLLAGIDLFHIPFISSFLSVVASILFVLVYLVAILFSILGIIRVRKDEEANFPLLSELAYHIYGQSKPQPVIQPNPYTIPYGQPQQAPYAPQPPQAQQQAYPGQPAYTAAPQYAPLAAPAANVQQPQEAAQDGPDAQ